MKIKCILILSLALIGILLGGCASTRTENGVTIEKQGSGSLNPLSYIPFL